MRPAWRRAAGAGGDESVVLQDTEEALGTLRHLKSIGVSLALDDFGTGYSSLGSLVRVPFDRGRSTDRSSAGSGSVPIARRSCALSRGSARRLG